MKKLTTTVFAILVLAAASCKPDKTDDVTPTDTVTPVSTIELSGNIATQTLDATKKYLLKGQVFVQDGSVLTIPAGTVIMGDKATKGTLVINLGGKIMAEGTASKPIVFTSEESVGERDKGDWGGIIILGRANCNQNAPSIEGVSPAVTFGTFQSTANDGENSGVLKYVRIEYAGIALSPNNETNGLTMGAIGSGTTIENVQVSFGGDDSFEWFGGTVNCKNLVAFAGWDDDFDCDFGYSGKVQFGLAIRDPFAADQSGSNAWECDNDAGGNNVTPYTSAVFSNVTVLGPIADSSKSISGNYQHAMHLRRRTAVSIFNSVITGFPTGFRLDGTSTEAQYATDSNGVVKSNILIALRKGTAAAAPYQSSTANVAKNYWEAHNDVALTVTAGNASLTTAGVDASLFYANNSTYPSNPNFGLLGTGTSGTGANFTYPKLSGFTSTSYRGAFSGSDWTDGWAEFDPQNKAY